MMRKAKTRLRNQIGETIGETLVALLISSLALMMLAGAISTAANIITRNKDSMNTYYETDQRSFESDWDSKVDDAWTNLGNDNSGTSQAESGGGA